MTSRVQVPLPRILVVQSDSTSTRKIVEFIMPYGYEIAGTDDGWFDADVWMDANAPDAAILEFIDGDDACLRFARPLAGMGIPIPFYTSRESNRGMPADLRAVPSLEKLEQFDPILKPLRDDAE